MFFSRLIPCRPVITTCAPRISKLSALGKSCCISQTVESTCISFFIQRHDNDQHLFNLYFHARVSIILMLLAVKLILRAL